MTAPEHSKKSKTITIDLEPNAVQDVELQTMEQEEPVPHDVKRDEMSANQTPASAPINSKPTGSRLGYMGAGLIGGLIALCGAATLQYTGQLPSFDSNAEIISLRSEMATLKAAPSPDLTSIDTLSASYKDLSAQVSALTAELGAIKSAPSNADAATITTMQQKLASLETALAAIPIGGTTNDAATSAQLKTLMDKITALEARPVDTGDAKSVALAIAASSLKAAIDRGGPFSTEFEAYARIAPASPDGDALRALADNGVPSQSDLIAAFDDAAHAMIAASSVPEPDMGILQRLTASAKSLVKIRTIGQVDGDEPDAVVARMEVALQKGNLASVIDLSKKLPELSLTAGKSFLTQVSARHDANTYVTRALGAALAQAGGKS